MMHEVLRGELQHFNLQSINQNYGAVEKGWVWGTNEHHIVWVQDPTLGSLMKTREDKDLMLSQF